MATHAAGAALKAEPRNPDEVHKWLVAVTVLTGTIMAVLDASIVNVALPSMTGTFGASVEEIAWVVTGYILAQVIVMPITALERRCARGRPSAAWSSRSPEASRATRPRSVRNSV